MDETPYAKGYKDGLRGNAWSANKFSSRMAKIAYHHGYTYGNYDRVKENNAQLAPA